MGSQHLVQLASLAEILIFLLSRFPVKALNLSIFVLIKSELEERHGAQNSAVSSERNEN